MWLFCLKWTEKQSFCFWLNRQAAYLQNSSLRRSSQGSLVHIWPRVTNPPENSPQTHVVDSGDARNAHSGQLNWSEAKKGIPKSQSQTYPIMLNYYGVHKPICLLATTERGSTSSYFHFASFTSNICTKWKIAWLNMARNG